MTAQDQLTAKQIQYETLTARIASLPSGPIRTALKRQRNECTGEMVVLRQMLIQTQIDIALSGGTPVEIPRLQFGK